MNLEQLLQDKIDTRVFIDTCSLMHPKFEKFLAKVVPVLSLYGYKLVVPWSCIEELNKHKTNPKQKSKAEKALKELESIYQFNMLTFVEMKLMVLMPTMSFCEYLHSYVQNIVLY